VDVSMCIRPVAWAERRPRSHLRSATEDHVSAG
jgi:hypothetical protein